MMVKGLFLAIFFIVIVIFTVLMLNTPICDGGDLIRGCGKILFPWRKKFKLPSGKWCCTSCYARDLKMFAQLKKDSDNDPFKFKVMDEEFLDSSIDGDSNDDSVH